MLFAKHRPKLAFLFSPDEERRHYGEAVTEDTDSVPDVPRLRKFDLLFYAIAMVTYMADIVSDMVVAYTHYTENRVFSAILIAGFGIIPSAIINIASFIWTRDEEIIRKRRNEEGWSKGSRVCCLLLGPIFYYARAIYAGWKSRKNEGKLRKKYYDEMIYCERDATLLRLFEAFIESCPQLLIQGFLLSSIVWAHDPRRELPTKVLILCVSIFFSLFSVALSISNQHRSLRYTRKDKLNMLVCETLIQILWRFGTILARFLVLLTFCLAKTYWIILFIFIHFAISVIHIGALQSVSIGPDGSPTMELTIIFFNGCIHFFAPFNTAEGNTRWRYATAYTIELLEASGIFFITLRDNTFNFPYKFGFLYLAAISYTIGFAFMIIYYTIFHPTKRKYRGEAETDESVRLKAEGHEKEEVTNEVPIEEESTANDEISVVIPSQQ